MSNPAVSYEREMVPVLFGPWVASLLEAAPPRPSDRVLDLACGTGIVARSVTQRLNGTAGVAGLDLNPAMLEVAREVSIREGLRIDWHQGRAEALPFVPGSFDLVLCQQGLHSSLISPLRSSKAGGCWRAEDASPSASGAASTCIRCSRSSTTRWSVTRESARWRPFALSDGGALRALLADAGFTRISVEPHSRTARFKNPRGFVAMEVDVIAAAIPSMQHYDTIERERLATTLTRELEAPIRDATLDGELVIPFHAHIATAARD